jgi:hypothetical protein
VGSSKSAGSVFGALWIILLVGITQLSAMARSAAEPGQTEGQLPSPAEATEIALPPPPAPGVDCDGFFPTLVLTSGEHDPSLLAAAVENRSDHDQIEPFVPSAGADYNKAQAANDFENNLATDKTLPTIMSNADFPLWPWRAKLWAACKSVPQVAMNEAQFQKFDGVLLQAYRDKIVQGPLPLDRYPACSVEAPLSDNAIRIWKMWTAYNNGLYGDVLSDASTFETDFGTQAEAMNGQVTGAPLQGSACDILARGLLNDVAAERWMRAHSTTSRADANAAKDDLLCVDKGVVLDKVHNNFWQPSLDVDREHHSCPSKPAPH